MINKKNKPLKKYSKSLIYQLHISKTKNKSKIYQKTLSLHLKTSFLLYPIHNFNKTFFPIKITSSKNIKIKNNKLINSLKNIPNLLSLNSSIT